MTIEYAGMAELADALDSGSSESNFMEVQVLLPAPKKTDEFSLVGLFFGMKSDLWHQINRIGNK